MNDGDPLQAPGWPGIAPRWTSSAKSGVGTVASRESQVWFTISHGIVNEDYYPRLDQANMRDLGLLFADGATFFSEEKCHTVLILTTATATADLPLRRPPAAKPTIAT